jgi:hypothetical protein
MVLFTGKTTPAAHGPSYLKVGHPFGRWVGGCRSYLNTIFSPCFLGSFLAGAVVSFLSVVGWRVIWEDFDCLSRNLNTACCDLFFSAVRPTKVRSENRPTVRGEVYNTGGMMQPCSLRSLEFFNSLELTTSKPHRKQKCLLCSR